jgi:hypothetical protein
MGTVYRLQMPSTTSFREAAIIDPIDFVLIPAPTGQRYRLMNYDGPYAAFDVEPFFMSRWAMLGGEDGTFSRVCSPNKYGLKLPSKDEWTCTKVDWSTLGISDPIGLSVDDVLPNRFRMDSKVGGFILELRGARMGRKKASTARPRAQDVMSADTPTSKHPFRLVMPFDMMKWIMNNKDWVTVTQLEMS